MDEFEEKMKEALHEAIKGFEVSDEIKERITERIKKAEVNAINKAKREKEAAQRKESLERG